MSAPYVFSNSDDFYGTFQTTNCAKNGGCWWDRNEECPFIAKIFLEQQTTCVVKNEQGNPVCTAYISLADGNKRQREEDRQHLLEEHGGGLFPELGQQQ